MTKYIVAFALLSFSVAHAQAPAPAAEKKPAAAPEKKPAAADTKAPAGAAPGSSDEMAKMMEMSKPGPNQTALKPFMKSASFTGTHTNPTDGKEIPTKGKQTCKWLPGNMWAACDIDQTAGTGKTAMHWMGHLVFGWDNVANGYRAFMTDNFGMSSRMKGTLEGTKMVWESMDEMKGPPNAPSKERVTDEGGEKLTFEGLMNGKWVPMGSATMKAAAK
jgi:hypothetical protein